MTFRKYQPSNDTCQDFKTIGNSDSNLSRKIVGNWFTDFKCGSKITDDAEHSVRPNFGICARKYKKSTVEIPDT